MVAPSRPSPSGRRLGAGRLPSCGRRLGAGRFDSWRARRRPAARAGGQGRRPGPAARAAAARRRPAARAGGQGRGRSAPAGGQGRRPGPRPAARAAAARRRPAARAAARAGGQGRRPGPADRRRPAARAAAGADRPPENENPKRSWRSWPGAELVCFNRFSFRHPDITSFVLLTSVILTFSAFCQRNPPST